MTATAEQFFDQFAEDFNALDGALIARRYRCPCLAVSATGEIQAFLQPIDVAGYFQTVIDAYREQGIVACRYTMLETTPISDNCSLASVTWHMLDKEDNVISSWRESYNLIQSDTALEIFTSIDH